MAADDDTLLVGVDGGGSGTRLLAQWHGRCVEVTGGPSGLGLGVTRAWHAILEALKKAQQALGLALPTTQCRLALGLAGANQSSWRDAFLQAAPRLAGLRLESDAFTTLIGAHQGRPGAIVALGTGSVGEALHADGRRSGVGGYGFPSGDEASGAWLGLRASRHVQHALDGRAAPDDFSRALCEAMSTLSPAPVTCAATLTHWLSSADQTRFAALAPVVIQHGEHPIAQALLQQAGEDIALMYRALDPQAQLPLALCGGLAHALEAWVPQGIKQQLVRPHGSSVEGALRLAGE
ncbi:BadF/BadG/BcrA/BcrD ATPase family protein [Kushneria indalinina]|uniref:Glucosamine kinase n=1 Tax=Kushneria indalinina DSM 14324 TaxID=1122140 RepID=A0A3D9DYK4_9GAMM|nr:BadF/BadG/BcrA/BcrD ATPase family protein [Kushneria indalinina]REC95872.1 glucosamine kinase [Kushneria indalinina DSM 14324]